MGRCAGIGPGYAKLAKWNTKQNGGAGQKGSIGKLTRASEGEEAHRTMAKMVGVMLLMESWANIRASGACRE
jgi:hypothetical protein